jgi:spermidine synthase
MKRTTPLFLFIGFGSTLSQLVLLREFLVTFYGNELSIGIFYACWLFWIGVGSLVGNRFVKSHPSGSSLFSRLLFTAPLLSIVQLTAFRFTRQFLPTNPGEYSSIGELTAAAFLILSLGSLVWGMLFSVGSGHSVKIDSTLSAGVRSVYILESIGSVAAGLLFSFYFAGEWGHLQVLVFNFCFVILLLSFLWSDEILAVRLIGIFPLLLFFVSFTSLQQLDERLSALQWSHMGGTVHFRHTENTKYQNITVLQTGDQYTIFSNGKPAVSIPNTYDAEMFVHPVMIHAQSAERILIVGGAVPGVLRELLKYPTSKIDYLEIDDRYLSCIHSYLTDSDRVSLRDLRVSVLERDGREYLRNGTATYDVILILTGEPATSVINRFYTAECFQQCKKILNPGGIVSFKFHSSEDYFSKELLDFNASMFATFTKIFPNVLIIPGTDAILIGSDTSAPLESNPAILGDRFEKTGIRTEYFSRYRLQEIMLQERREYVLSSLQTVPSPRINEDRSPVVYYYDMALWNKKLTNEKSLLPYIERFSLLQITGVLIIITKLIKLLGYTMRGKDSSSILLPIIIFYGGYLGMGFTIILIMEFQAFFGSVYEMIGALTASYMGGLALGAVIFSSVSNKNMDKYYLLGILLIAGLLIYFLPNIISILFSGSAQIVPILLALSGGLFIGALFNLTNRMYLTLQGCPGSIYGFDVFGGALSGLITSTLLLPIYGIEGVSTMMVGMAVFCAGISLVLKREI